VDNYLDGGYHVPHAHKGLAASSSTQVHHRKLRAGCLQSSPLDSRARLNLRLVDAAGDGVLSVGLPNFMLECVFRRDGHHLVCRWASQCAVIFDYYLRTSAPPPRNTTRKASL